MKKISFKSLGAFNVDQLSREQLKTVLGGSNGSGSGSNGCPEGKLPCTVDNTDVGCRTPSECCSLVGVVC